jgi:hypothetical protein
VKNSNRWAEVTYQPPIPIAIFFKRLLPFLKQFKDGIGGVGLLELLDEGILRKIDSSLVGIVGQGIDYDQLEVGMGCGCMSRHDVG